MEEHVRVDLHVYVHDGEPSARVTERLDQMLTRLGVLEHQEHSLMATVQQIKDQADKVLAAVTAESTKDDAIIALVNGQTAQLVSIKQQLADAIAGGADPAALQAVVDSMTAAETSALANAQRVTDAINANTPPAAPAPPV